MDSCPEFGRFSSAAEVGATLKGRIRGKTVVITGGNPNGLGAATAKAIAPQEPATLIITYRFEAKAADLLTELRSIAPKTNVVGIMMDLADLQSIRKAAKEVNQFVDHINILINNAGVMSIQTRELTNYAVEMQFGTNHIGHFLFTNLLLPMLLVAAEKNSPEDTRVINLTGEWHQFSPVHFDDINWEGKPIPPEQEPNKALLAKYGNKVDRIYLPEAAYAQSKTANILFTLHLNKGGRKALFPMQLIPEVPSRILTELGRNLPDEKARRIIESGLLDKSPDQGASSTMVAAFAQGICADDSPYIDDCHQATAAPHATDPALAEKLWMLSEEIVGQKFML